MANALKILGQLNPTANTQGNVYVVPAATAAVVNNIVVANQSASNASYSIIVMPSGSYSATLLGKSQLNEIGLNIKSGPQVFSINSILGSQEIIISVSPENQPSLSKSKKEFSSSHSSIASCSSSVNPSYFF